MKKLILIILFWLIPFLLMSQTEIISVVDPGGTGDYTSLQDWANSRAGNLITRNTIETAKCINTNGSADAPTTITGFITDSTHYIKIYVDLLYRHKGIFPNEGQHIYRIDKNIHSNNLFINTSKVIIEGLAIKDNLAGGIGILLQDCKYGGYIKNCIIEGIKDTNDQHGHGIRLDAVNEFSRYYITNNIIYGFNNYDPFTPSNCGILTYPVGDSMRIWVDNNTLYNNKYGIWNRGGEEGYYNCWATVRNNLAQNPNSTIYSEDFFQTKQYVKSSNNVSLPSYTPEGSIYIENNNFENDSLPPITPFINGDTDVMSLADFPIHSGKHSLFINTGWEQINIYTKPITNLESNKDYTLKFYSSFGWGNYFTVKVLGSDGGQIGNSVNTSTEGTNFKEHIIHFNSGNDTAIVIDISGGNNGGAVFLDDFYLYSGSGIQSAYFIDILNNDFHLNDGAILAIRKGLPLSLDLENPFNKDIDFETRGFWDIGADEFNPEYKPPISGLEPINNQMRNGFLLKQNYPNPFSAGGGSAFGGNPITKIRYVIPNIVETHLDVSQQKFASLQNGVSVYLKVYDILGKEIATLVNEEKSPGEYEVEFNANGLSSGIYFYKIEAGNFVNVKKMIILK